MFDLFRQEKDSNIYSPVDGEAIPIEKVPDKMFSEKILGDGIAFVFSGGYVCAPLSGKLEMVASTKHAFGVKGKNGQEVLVHIGLDTVKLQGKGFTVLCKVGSIVKKGDKIIKVDPQVFKDNGIDLITMAVITSGGNPICKKEYGKVEVGNLVIKEAVRAGRNWPFCAGRERPISAERKGPIRQAHSFQMSNSVNC